MYDMLKSDKSDKSDKSVSVTSTYEELNLNLLL